MCDCGTEAIVYAYNLIGKKAIKSCGCARSDFLRRLSFRHGKAKTKIYNIWSGIKQRTTNEKYSEYHLYGARGILMFKEWEDSFPAFLAYFGDPPFDGASLDRIDNNEGYFPGNVRWATQKEQCNNKRNNATLTVNGLTKTQAQWAESSGISRSTIAMRIKAGWNESDAVTLKVSPISRSKR